MIETETNTPVKNPVPWLTPMLVMWGSAAIVLGIIVLGTWLNNRKALAETKEVRDKFAKVLEDFAFTPEQRTTLELEYQITLHAAHSGDDRRELAQRLTDRLSRSIGCVVLENSIAAIGKVMTPDGGHAGNPDLLPSWPATLVQCNRLLFAADHGGCDLQAAVELCGDFLKRRTSWTPEKLEQFKGQCQKLADSAKAPADPPPFVLYESLFRGIVEARESK